MTDFQSFRNIVLLLQMDSVMTIDPITFVRSVVGLFFDFIKHGMETAP
jgi:hypothetical protein